jgi:hypothetical protein
MVGKARRADLGDKSWRGDTAFLERRGQLGDDRFGQSAVSTAYTVLAILLQVQEETGRSRPDRVSTAKSNSEV